MPTRTVFHDFDGNEMECYVNDKGDLFISVGKGEEDMYSGYITMKRDDVKEFIKILQQLEKEVNEE